MSALKFLADENIADATLDQLEGFDVSIARVTEFFPEGTPDPELLEYANANGYALLTHDEHITRHVAARRLESKAHGGVFIAGHHLQGVRGIGAIVKLILEYHQLIAGGAGTVREDVQSHIVYV